MTMTNDGTMDTKKDSMSVMSNSFMGGITLKDPVMDTGSIMMDSIKKQREHLEDELREADIAFSRAYHKDKYSTDAYEKTAIVQKIEEKLKLIKQLEKDFQNMHTPLSSCP